MSAVPAEIDTDRQPPMAIPLGHFLVGLGFLLAGSALGVLDAVGLAPGRAGLAHVHLLLVGWVCLTILGAMTQFVPVWTGTSLHSRRLARLQLWLVAAGIAGFAASLLADAMATLPVFGALLLAGLWTFAYNVARTLPPVRTLDVTAGHFAVALGFFVALAPLGLLLAVDLASPGLAAPVLAAAGVSHANVLAAHATLAVFGSVLTTVLGALYQLATMFTSTDLRGVDHHLRRVETAGYPVGVVGLATGQLIELAVLARVGGVLVATGLLAFAVVLGRRLHESAVPWTPMLRRYAVVAVAMATWALATLPAWLADPLAPTMRFGAPGASHLLAVGVVGFVVLGTLYHVVPFVVWMHRYSDRLGLDPVPTIDELYDDRLAAVDLAALLVGGALVVLAEWAGLPRSALAIGGLFVAVGVAVFAANLAGVLRSHVPDGLAGLLAPRLVGDGRGGAESAEQR